MLILTTLVALMISQNSTLPGPDDATFEQRWQNMIVKQIIRKQTDEIMQPEPEPRRVERPQRETRARHHRPHRSHRVARGCRFGHRVFHNNGKSWRCKR
jgi:hypothetical protein